ncbi:MAG: hypothetical protein V9G63_02060 [Candidatus Competibacter sp.]
MKNASFFKSFAGTAFGAFFAVLLYIVVKRHLCNGQVCIDIGDIKTALWYTVAVAAGLPIGLFFRNRKLMIKAQDIDSTKATS